MNQRLITGLIFAACIIAAVFYMPHLFFMGILLLIVFVSFWEWTQFVTWPRKITMSLFVIATVFSIIVLNLNHIDFFKNTIVDISSTHLYWIPLLISIPWWFCSLILVATHPHYQNSWCKNNVVKFFFGILTLIPFLVAVVMLRYIPKYLTGNEHPFNDYHGILLLLLGCIIVWSADSGAYYGGRRFGKHKLAPNVSPNKTIEGVISGMIVSFICALIFTQLTDLKEFTVINLFLIVLIIVPVTVLGDLNESMLKRVTNIKDSGHFLPGHGGILDRIDGLSAALPIYTLLYFTLVH